MPASAEKVSLRPGSSGEYLAVDVETSTAILAGAGADFPLPRISNITDTSGRVSLRIWPVLAMSRDSLVTGLVVSGA